jgi:ADP-ribosylglycohydrolase
VGIVCAAAAPDGTRPAFDLGVEVSRLTHGHPTGYLAGGFFAEVIAHLLDGTALPEAIALASAPVREHERGGELLAAVDAAVALADEGAAPTAERVASLGAGWVAEEAVAIALYAALAAPDFESAVGLAVNHGGDSDSTGALAGNLLGALLGEQAIPQRWLDGLELRPVIEQVARDLVGLRSGALDIEEAERRYPGW